MLSTKVLTLTVATLFSTLFLNQGAQAKEPRIVQQLKKVAPQFAKKKALKKISPICTNFSGNWVGTCVETDGYQEPIEMTIEQEKCEYIVMDGWSFNINGLNTIANSPSPNAEWPLSVGGSISTSWNDAQTRLYTNAGFSVGSWFSVVATQEIWLEGDTLRQKDTAAYALDPTGVPSPMQQVLQDCTMNRR
jgi:hypothetical protein